MSKVLVVDAGGRGNAIAHAFSKSEKVEKVYVAPGNAGSSLLEKCKQVPIKAETKEEETKLMAEFARDKDIDLTFVGPEGYISAGIVDRFTKEGLPIVGPTKDAAILELSKCDTKDYLNNIGVPIPEYKNFSDAEDAKDFVSEIDKKVVVKADGIAQGKGSFVCESVDDASYAINKIKSEDFARKYGDAGSRFVVEERLYGDEMGFFAITDGETIKPFGTAKDYKRAFDEGDASIRLFGGINPNTGGMGGYSPHKLEDELRGEIMEKIAKPTIENFDTYKGILHFVLMIEEGPKVLEINVREGDPEGQMRLPRLRTDMYELSTSIVEENLAETNLEWDPNFCLGVCAVSGKIWGDTGGGVYDRICEGYPGAHFTNQPIYEVPKDLVKRRYPKLVEKYGKIVGRDGMKGLDESCMVYHNGTAFGDGKLQTTGGRVLTVVGKGESLEKARDAAYRNVERIWFRGMRYRANIGRYEREDKERNQ